MTTNTDTYCVECLRIGTDVLSSTRFPGLGWDDAVARCEAERTKSWTAVTIRSEATGRVIRAYTGAVLTVEGVGG